MKKYFVFLRNQELGPMTIDQVKLLGIQSSTLVRSEGSSNWIAAGQVEEIRKMLAGISVTAGNSSNRPPVTRKRSSDIVMPDHSDMMDAQKNRQKRLFYFVAILMIALGVAFYIKQTQHTPYSNNPSSEKKEDIINLKDTVLTEEGPRFTPPAVVLSAEKDKPADYLRIVATFHDNSTAKDVITGFITNTATTTTYKNVGFTVFYLDKNKVSLDIESFKVFNTIPPGETIRYQFRVEAPKNTFSTDVTYDEATVL